jgi:hypothetical protein
MTKAFVSYSWESDKHKHWVRELATRLRTDGIDVTLDQWDLVPGDQVPEFMEKEVRESDYVLIVCTPKYKDRSDNREGGVGYEGDIMTAEAMTTRNERKFIPLLRGNVWEECAPSWLLGKYYLDFSSTPYSENSYEDLLTTILGIRPKAPPIGRGKRMESVAKEEKATKTPKLRNGFEDIYITGVIVDEVGTPRMDGTPGSSLYRVPFKLSRTPPGEWTELFLHFWDRPPRYTSMHRPGIASVVGDRAILDGTTIDEVKKYHRDTLILACEEANKAYSDFLAKRAAQEERERKRREGHKRTVEDIAKQISFDDDDA